MCALQRQRRRSCRTFNACSGSFARLGHGTVRLHPEPVIRRWSTRFCVQEWPSWCRLLSGCARVADTRAGFVATAAAVGWPGRGCAATGDGPDTEARTSPVRAGSSDAAGAGPPLRTRARGDRAKPAAPASSADATAHTDPSSRALTAITRSCRGAQTLDGAPILSRLLKACATLIGACELTPQHASSACVDSSGDASHVQEHSDHAWPR